MARSDPPGDRGPRPMPAPGPRTAKRGRAREPGPGRKLRAGRPGPGAPAGTAGARDPSPSSTWPRRACGSSSTSGRCRTRSGRRSRPPTSTRLLGALDADPQDGESFAFMLAADGDDPTTPLAEPGGGGAQAPAADPVPALRGADRRSADAPRGHRGRRLAGRAGRGIRGGLPRGRGDPCRSPPASRWLPRCWTWRPGRCRTSTSGGPPRGSGSGCGPACSWTLPPCWCPAGRPPRTPGGCST